MEISIIIPLYNNWQLSQNCLQSIAGGISAELSYEIILIDNASYDDTAQQIQKLATPTIRYVQNEKNLGFARACNLGAQEASGNYLLFLNNDIIVLSAAITASYQALTTLPNIGIVGSRLLYPDYTIQHAGLAMDENYDWWHIYRGYTGFHPLVLERRIFQAVTGAAMMLSALDFSHVGGFDESYLNSHEDLDLCLKIRQMGKEILYEPESVMFHFESASDGRYGFNEKKKFIKKWQSVAKNDYKEKTYYYAQKKADIYQQLHTEKLAQKEITNLAYMDKEQILWFCQREFYQQSQKRFELELELKQLKAQLDRVIDEHYLINIRIGKILLFIPQILKKLLQRIFK